MAWEVTDSTPRLTPGGIGCKGLLHEHISVMQIAELLMQLEKGVPPEDSTFTGRRFLQRHWNEHTCCRRHAPCSAQFTLAHES